MKNLSLSLEEYRDLCNNATDLIQSVIPNGHFKYVNNTWLRVLGYTRREVAKMTIFDIIHSDEIEHCQRLFNSVMSGEDVGLVTTTFVTKNGQNIIVEGSVNCNFIGDKPVYTRAVFRDITRRKQVEEALEESEGKWRSLVGTTDDTIQIVDKNSVIRYINRTIPPTTPEGVIGNTVYKYVSEAHHDVMREALKRVYKTGEPDSYEITLDMSNINPEIGTLWFNTKVVPIIIDKEVTDVIMIATNITERKQIEEEREQLIQELQETLKEVRTLSGLLPICAWCKKLRDDDGYWKSVEQYIGERTKAEFTHGMCPECLNKYFPENSTEENGKEHNNSEVR